LAGEHTGQLSYELRQKNEHAFRHEENKELNITEKISLCALFCSPTMELGIDISELIAVHMRNVPPNPANYTQRSGRAGRSGQGALVFTYCGQMNPHDRHYFEHKQDMVAGIVRPIHLDFRNEELWSTHLHAVALSLIGLKELQVSIGDVINIEHPDLPLKDVVESEVKSISSDKSKRERLKQFLTKHYECPPRRFVKVLWFYDGWLDEK